MQHSVGLEISYITDVRYINVETGLFVLFLLPLIPVPPLIYPTHHTIPTIRIPSLLSPSSPPPTPLDLSS